MKKYILIFVVVGFLVYIQSLFNGFVWDDIEGQVVNNSLLYGFDKIPRIFLYHWSPYYKPIFYVFLNFFITIFGEKSFSIHFFQLLIHIVNSLLIFSLFSRFFKKDMSFILALIFLVHPAISEAVFYVSALQDVLYPFFGLLALNVLIYSKESKYKHFLIFLFLALSVLSKETGVAFLVIVILYVFHFEKINFKKYILYTACFAVAYLIFRIGFLRINPFNKEFQSILTYDASFTIRLLTIPKIFSQYLTLFVWPSKLQIFQLWWVRGINFPDFYLPLVLMISFLGGIIGYGILVYKRLKKSIFPYLFFTSFFILGLMLHIQIIPLDYSFAERWFYLTLIGLLGMIGFILSNISLEGKRFKVFILFSVSIIAIFSLRTFVRSFDWYDQKTLAMHDFEVDKQNPGTYYFMADYYSNQGDYFAATKLYSQLSKIIPENETLTRALANIEDKKGNLDKAEEILRNSPKTTIITTVTYAYLLVRLDYKKATPFIKTSLRKFPHSHELYILLAFSEYKAGNRQEALKYTLKARDLNPSLIEYTDTYRLFMSGAKLMLD